ncbi:MAG: hypothetical protein DMG49_05960 [Acidobacteria bacterium]|nr:MAG: hypothetical protein DMG49_05960 [Acidobacteriota bacterium]
MQSCSFFWPKMHINQAYMRGEDLAMVQEKSEKSREKSKDFTNPGLRTLVIHQSIVFDGFQFLRKDRSEDSEG